MYVYINYYYTVDLMLLLLLFNTIIFASICSIREKCNKQLCNQ